MAYSFPPELSRLVQKTMESGQYASEDDLLADAIHALDDLHQQHVQLRAEIQDRLRNAGKEDAKPLDREAFKAEARRRLSEEG